jgi:hypothetical protein
MSKIKINNPLSKGNFRTFIQQYIQIHFFQPKQNEEKEINKYKQFLFPPQYKDDDYTNFTKFITLIMDQTIMESKTLNQIKQSLIEEYDYDNDTVDVIYQLVLNQKSDIVNTLNKPFEFAGSELKKLNWATKMVLSGNAENYYNGKYADLEFAYIQSTKQNNVAHKTISFTKNDIDKVINEFKKIKDNLNKINTIQ